jgi:hypothetical protein
MRPMAFHVLSPWRTSTTRLCAWMGGNASCDATLISKLFFKLADSFACSASVSAAMACVGDFLCKTTKLEKPIPSTKIRHPYQSSSTEIWTKVRNVHSPYIAHQEGSSIGKMPYLQIIGFSSLLNRRFKRQGIFAPEESTTGWAPPDSLSMPSPTPGAWKSTLERNPETIAAGKTTTPTPRVAELRCKRRPSPSPAACSTRPALTGAGFDQKGAGSGFAPIVLETRVGEGRIWHLGRLQLAVADR